MKPYLTHTSPRPGCPCCKSKHLHGIHGLRIKNAKQAKRIGRKSARKLRYKQITEQLRDLKNQEEDEKVAIRRPLD